MASVSTAKLHVSTLATISSLLKFSKSNNFSRGCTEVLLIFDGLWTNAFAESAGATRHSNYCFTGICATVLRKIGAKTISFDQFEF